MREYYQYLQDYLNCIQTFVDIKQKIPNGTAPLTALPKVSINKNGDASPPSIVDSQLIPWDFKVGIGNGSFCAVRLAMIPYEQFGGGIAFRIDGIQVIKHVPYELKDPTEGFDKVDEGELPF